VKSIRLLDYVPEGLPGPEHFDIVTEIFNFEESLVNLTPDSVIFRAQVFSADPYLRNRMKAGRHLDPLIPGEIIKGYTAGVVIASKNDKWQVGDYYGANLPLKTITILSGEALSKSLVWKLPSIINDLNISYGIGVLGMPGSTAYGGLIDVLRPLQGETIFISAAAGAVGGLVGMLAKSLLNCRVIGSCGGESKVNLVKEKFGFDHAINYKNIGSKEELIAALREVAPEGIDMYFDNVGGMHLEAALELLRVRGRIAICGQIVDYNSKEMANVPFSPWKMIYTQQRIEGFLCSDWLVGKKGNFHRDMPKFVIDGKVIVEETVFEGIESWPLGFQSLFTGGNTGKVVIRV
jgi:NADPH:quinone reductase